MTHSPAKVLSKWLIDTGFAIAYNSNLSGWKVFLNSKPSEPAQLITIYNTAGYLDGRVMPTGEKLVHEGVQIVTRATDPEVASKKLRDIRIALDEDLYREVVAIDSSQYRVQSFSMSSPPAAMGFEENNRGALYVMNGLLTIEEL